jgi:hypothetical protein
MYFWPYFTLQPEKCQPQVRLILSIFNRPRDGVAVIKYLKPIGVGLALIGFVFISSLFIVNCS